MPDFCCCQNDVRLVTLHSVHDLAGWGRRSGTLSSVFTREAVFPDTGVSGWSGEQEDDTVMEGPARVAAWLSSISPQFSVHRTHEATPYTEGQKWARMLSFVAVFILRAF